MGDKAICARAGRAAALAWLSGVAACSHMPWHHPPPPPPAPVHALDISGPGTAAFPQYWQRNTLLLDLSAARGSGRIVLKPAAGTAWPVRLAFRVRPGSIGRLEVRAAQRVILPIVPAGPQSVDLELSPGVYRPETPQMTVSWGPGLAP